MSQYLASDDANPEFVGAFNPDSRLSARFFTKPLQNNFRSEIEGRPIFEDIEMVEIHVPGDKYNIVCQPTREDHKKRFPLQWAHYANRKEGDQRLAGKTPINQWPRLTPAQAEELRHMKFLSVEDVANASDTALQALGMVGGMSPFAFREHAQRFLQAAAGDAALQKESAVVQALREQNAALQEQMQAQAARMASFENRFAALADKNNAAIEAPAAPEQEEPELQRRTATAKPKG